MSNNQRNNNPGNQEEKKGRKQNGRSESRNRNRGPRNGKDIKSQEPLEWSRQPMQPASFQNSRRDVGRGFQANSNRQRYDQSNRQRNEPPRIGLKQIEELLAKNPEDIILSFSSPRFQIANYLNTPTMGDALIQKLALVLNKAFECNSIQVMMRQQVDSIVESTYFKTHLYEAITKVNRANSTYNLDLIELAINMCRRFLYVQPSSHTQLGPIKDRIELLLLTKKINSDKLKDLFDDLVVSCEEAVNRYNLLEYISFILI